MSGQFGIDERTLTEVAEIRRLLAEAYEHYFEGSDGYCKSSEGAVTLQFPPFFWRADEPGSGRPSVSVYSYVLGPSRLHDFDDSTQALAAVRRWHKREMATRYCVCKDPTSNGFDHSKCEQEEQ